MTDGASHSPPRRVTCAHFRPRPSNLAAFQHDPAKAAAADDRALGPVWEGFSNAGFATPRSSAPSGGQLIVCAAPR